MFPIDTTAGQTSSSLPAYGSAGTAAYFQDTGSAGGTVLPAWWANMMQQELKNLVTLAGLTLSKSDDTQVYQSIASMVAAAITEATASLKPQQYAVGDIFVTTRTGNPATMSDIGYGTWVRCAEGMVMVGYKASDSDFSTVGNTGGEKTHTLTTSEMPSHSHNVQILGNATGDSYVTMNDGSGTGRTFTSTSTGGGGAHNNMPPYYVVNYWLRIS